MPLGMLPNFREEQSVAKEGGDGKDNMKTNADAEGEQQNRF